MKKIFQFTKKKKGFSPSASETTSVLSAGYELKEKDLGKVHKAAASGDVSKLKQLAKKNDLNQLDKENRTALHIACVHGHTEVVQFLVESKVKLNLCDNQNRSALMKAVQCQQDRCVGLLLEHEADPNLVDINGNTALHLAALIPALPVAIQLLEHEANINAHNKDGNTPLILSVGENHVEMAELLLKEGADVDLINKEHRSALMMAACNGQITMVRLLLQYSADITIKDDKGWTSDDYAVMNGHHACSHLIIEHGTKRKLVQSPSEHEGGKKQRPSTALAAASGDVEVGFSLGGPATDKDDFEDNSHTDSISRASKSGPADSWPSSDDDDDLDLSPKKPQKVNLKKLLSASKKDRSEALTDPDRSWSGDECEHGGMGSGAERPPPPFLRAPLLNSTPKHPVAPSPSPSLPPQTTSLPFNQPQQGNVSMDEDEEVEGGEDDDDEEEDDDEEDEDERLTPEEEPAAQTAADTSVMKKEHSPQQQQQRDFMSELGLDKGNGEDDDSPWDSESASDSPKKQAAAAAGGPSPLAKRHSTMANLSEHAEEPKSDHDDDDKEEAKSEHPEEAASPQQPAMARREPVSVLSRVLDCTGQSNRNADLMEELGLGDVDDLEDASDWDSASTASKASRASKASKASPSFRLDEEPERDAMSVPVLPVLQERDLASPPALQERDPSSPGPAQERDTASPAPGEAQERDTASPAPGVAHRPESFPSATAPRPSPRRSHSALSPLRLQPQLVTPKPGSSRPDSEEGSDWDSEPSTPASPASPAKSFPENDNMDTMDTPALDDREPSAVGDEDTGGKAGQPSGDSNSMVEETEDDGGILKGSVRVSRTLFERDLEKGKKPKTVQGNSKPQHEGTAGNAREQEFETRDSVAQQPQTSTPKSPKSTGRYPSQQQQQEQQQQCAGGAEELQGPRALYNQGSLPLLCAMGQPDAPQHTAHVNGDRLSVFDDSSLSEVSEDEGRSPTAARNTKSAGEVDMADDLEDLTQSSDTGTEELDSPASGYHHASLLIKQLDSTSIDNVSMVKLQNMFQEYERTIQRERGRHGRLAEKMGQLEQERGELRLLLEEARDGQSNLTHLKMELDTDVNNLRFQLKQEQEKHHNASMLYEKTREQLRRKEEAHRLEEETRQQVELTIRNLELEKRTLINTIKQLEEDRSEAQRQLGQERNARALQEEMLNTHLRKQQEIDQENRKNLTKSKEVLSQLTEAGDRERELQQQVSVLQEEVASLRGELERDRASSRQEEGRLSEEGDALRERLEDTRRDLKLSEEALAQTVFQFNSQLSTLKTECQVTSSRLEQERTTRQQLETENESMRVRLAGALQEVERSQAARAEAERALQRERDERQRALEKRAGEAGAHRDAVHELSQKLSQAEARANSLENECHRVTLSLTEKSLLLETVGREKEQTQGRLREVEVALQAEREQATRGAARQEATQERLAQAQSEGALLRQQLEEVQSKGVAKERAVTDAQERFSDILDKLRSDSEERVQLVEERSKELATKNADLREQHHKLEQEKADREAIVRELQQELADSLKKLSMCEASLEVNTRYRSDLEDEKGRILKDMDRLKTKLQEGEDQYVEAEKRINALRSSLDEKERDVIASAQKLQEVLASAAASQKTIKQLEEAVQRLEIDNARLEAAAKQQSNRIEALQKGAQEATAVRSRLEDLVTNLQSNNMTLEDQLNREVQKQGVLSHNAQDSQAMWEEELKSRSRLGIRLAELEKEKGELSSQMELEKKKAKKIGEQKKSVDARLEQEMQRNTELQKEMYRLRTLVKTAKKKLREQDGGELGSPMASLRGDAGHRQLETESAVSRMKTKVDELQVQLDKEASRCGRLETANGELREQLAVLKSLSRSHERLERSKRQLEEELAGLRRQLDSGVMDQSQAEQYRRDTEERARQEIRHKLEEVNLFLQTQAASQEALEQIKAANEASQRAQQEQRIKELELDLARTRGSQQDSLTQRESSRAELERYRQLYGDELRLRKSLAAKLDRANERLAEANTKLLSERQRSKSLITSSLVNGSLGGPGGVEVGSLGGSLGAYGGSLGALNRSLGLGGSFLGDPQSNRVEAYLAKMQSELEKNISKELDNATAELEAGSPRLSPVGSACGSQRSLAVDQDPVSRATQQYLEVLKKNYMI
ncbi:ankyrin repeat domain-containing protein 26 isoform X2 [Engraulis encrasicolus]|uniref:ankyrin repeat domain-containing protein 26 isoform X2 n=1 Tax=Engraulis encrasicolus TaxID=184585 RepID=UPI002FD506FC